MNIELSDNTIYNFEQVTNFYLTTYLNDYTYFIDNYLINYQNFYKGIIISVDATSQNAFNSLFLRSQQLTDLLKQISYVFTSNDAWVKND